MDAPNTPNPYGPKQDEPAAEPAEKHYKGRPVPEIMTQRWQATKRHRDKAYDERNQVLAVLAAQWESHLMPPTANLSKQTKIRVLCIHPNATTKLCWSTTEDDAKDFFAHVPELKESHWDQPPMARATNAERTKALADLVQQLRDRKDERAEVAKRRAQFTRKKKRATPPHDPTRRTRGGTPRRRKAR